MEDCGGSNAVFIIHVTGAGAAGALLEGRQGGAFGYPRAASGDLGTLQARVSVLASESIHPPRRMGLGI